MTNEHKKQENVLHQGVRYRRVDFVCQSAMMNLAGTFSCCEDLGAAQKEAAHAFKYAEALWDEFCNRFGDGEENQ